jgi:hypothetical protein
LIRLALIGSRHILLQLIGLALLAAGTGRAAD